jgi:hypothetical protein
MTGGVWEGKTQEAGWRKKLEEAGRRRLVKEDGRRENDGRATRLCLC